MINKNFCLNLILVISTISKYTIINNISVELESLYIIDRYKFFIEYFKFWLLNVIMVHKNSIKIVMLVLTNNGLLIIFILEINLQIYTNKTIIPPKNNKIIKYIIHFLDIIAI